MFSQNLSEKSFGADDNPPLDFPRKLPGELSESPAGDFLMGSRPITLAVVGRITPNSVGLLFREDSPEKGGEEAEPRPVFDVLVLGLKSSASESATNPNKEERNKCLAERA